MCPLLVFRSERSMRCGPGLSPILYSTKIFGLRVFPSGTKTWIVEYRPGVGGRKVFKRRMKIDLASRVPGMGRLPQGWLALHRSWKAPAERLQRELQWQVARRTAERDPVHLPGGRPRQAGSLAEGLQRGAAPTRASATSRQRHTLAPSGKRPARCEPRPLRAPASCQRRSRRFRSTPDSRYDWMRNWGQVNRCGREHRWLTASNTPSSAAFLTSITGVATGGAHAKTLVTVLSRGTCGPSS